MKDSPFYLLIVCVITTAIAVLCIIPTREAITPNVDALAQTEGYPIADCFVASTVGDDYTLMYFCDDKTDDYTIYDCKVSFRTPSLTKGKCVTH